MTQAIVDLFTPAQHLLRARLLPLLASLVQPLRADVMRALQAEGKLLWRPDCPTERPAGVWGLLTLLVAQHLSPDIDQGPAASIAVAVECYICALDLLDDVEDSDRTPVVEELGRARALSVATTLLFLAQRATLEAAGHLPLQQVVRLIAAFSDASLTATAGQHRDILTAQRAADSLSAEECMEILAAKSGSLMSLACRLGALCAGVSEQACEEWARLGELLGLAHQLDNDAHEAYDDLSADVPTRREVATQGCATKTLPVVLAAQIYAKQRKLHAGGDKEEDQRIWQLALQEAIVQTSGRAVLYCEQVRASIEQMEARHPLPPTLRFLLVG